MEIIFLTAMLEIKEIMIGSNALLFTNYTRQRALLPTNAFAFSLYVFHLLMTNILSMFVIWAHMRTKLNPTPLLLVNKIS